MYKKLNPSRSHTPVTPPNVKQKGRCYIVQEPLHMVDGVPVPRIGYHTITPYGTIKFLFTWSELRHDDALEETWPFLVRLHELLRNFNDNDYIVPLGNPTLVAMAVLVAAEVNDGRVKMLDWIRDERRYRVVQIDLNELDAALDAHEDDDTAA